MASFIKTCVLALATVAACKKTTTTPINEVCETTYWTDTQTQNLTTTTTATFYNTFTVVTTSTAKPYTSTTYTKTVTKHATSTTTFTFYSTTAPTTTTIPTGTNFTPFRSINATTLTSGSASETGTKRLRTIEKRERRNGIVAAPPGRRAPPSSPSSLGSSSSAISSSYGTTSTPLTTYATWKVCYESITIATSTFYSEYYPTVTKTAKTPATVTTTGTRTATTHSTVHASTATIFAACLDKANYSPTYDGKELSTFQNDGSIYIGHNGPSGFAGWVGTSGDHTLYQAGNQSPFDCCNAAFQLAASNSEDQSISGFAFEGPPHLTAHGTCITLGNPDHDEALSGTYLWTGEPYENVPVRLGATSGHYSGYYYEGDCDPTPSTYCNFNAPPGSPFSG